MGDAMESLLHDADGASLLHAMLEKLPAVLWAVDSQLRVTFSTGGEVTLFARRPGDLIGLTLHELVPDAREHAPLIAAHQQALRGEIASCEIHWGECTYHARACPLREQKGTIVGCTAFLQDVTEWRGTEEAIRKAYEEMEWRVQERTAKLAALNTRLQQEIGQRRQVQKSLQTTEKHFRLAFEEGPLGMAIIDRDSRLLQVNRALCRMLAYDEEELLDKSLLEITHPADHDTDRLLTQRLFDGKISNLTLERRYVRKDGQIVWARLTPTCLHDRDGHVMYGFSMIEDITDRRRMEEALRESEERFRLAFEKGPVGMCFIDTRGRFAQVNRAFCDMLGYRVEELVGQPATVATHADDRESQVTRVRQLVDGTLRGYTAEKRYVRKEGQTVWTQITATVVRDRRGHVLYGLAMIEDITTRKQAEETLRRAERLASIGTLAAGLAHELNNPLGAIILSAGAALRAMDQPGGRDILRRSLENVQSGAARCGQIVKSVSQFAHEEVSKKWPNDLGAVVHRAIHSTSRLAASRNVVVAFEPEGDLPEVDINPTEMEQVFIHLISNAIHASEPGGRVKVWGEWETGKPRVYVEDEGCGMSDEQRRQACDPFFTTRQQQGCAGLGLSIAYGIVEQHGGALRLRSRLGEGTTVMVMLPKTSPDETEMEGEDE